jgi:hypothetical protein
VEVILYSPDLADKYKEVIERGEVVPTVQLHAVSFEHFNEDVQKAIKIVGRAKYVNMYGG